MKKKFRYLYSFVAGPGLFNLHTKKGLTIHIFKNLPGLQKSGGNRLGQIFLSDLS